MNDIHKEIWNKRRSGQEIDERDYVRFEVFTAVNIKNGVFRDITQCGSCKNRSSGGI
jgi:hypothetical protein